MDLSPIRNCSRLMVGERRCNCKEFHVSGAATRKLRLPSFQKTMLIGWLSGWLGIFFCKHDTHLWKSWISNFLSVEKHVTDEAGDERRVWRYVVTMADEGRELKLWDCPSWTCLQTLSLAPCHSVPVHFQVIPRIKAQLDPTACYLVLSDIRRKVCYCNRDGERCFSRAGPAAWNSLPASIKLTTDTNRFKKLLKAHLFHIAFWHLLAPLDNL